MNFYATLVKPIIDRSAALILLLIFLPILLILSFLIYINMGSPIFFIQERGGKNSTTFNLIKFRSMKNLEVDEEEDVETKRVTALGSFIRKFSLDELPQLLNILKGDMSFIGPRPLYSKYIKLYSSEQIKRLDVLPGLSGLAQVKGRNSISWDEKFKFDVEYVNNQTFIMDFKIALLTLLRVFNSSIVNANDGLTMEEFKGSN